MGSRDVRRRQHRTNLLHAPCCGRVGKKTSLVFEGCLWVAFFYGRFLGVYIRYFGNGGLWFRPYGGSLLEEPGAGPAKSNQKRFAPPLGTSPRLGVPERRHCSVGSCG
ncbi:hypothetical protein EMIT0P228_80209 [Pseudomonas brassicacearum]